MNADGGPQADVADAAVVAEWDALSLRRLHHWRCIHKWVGPPLRLWHALRMGWGLASVSSPTFLHMLKEGVGIIVRALGMGSERWHSEAR